LQLDTNVQAIGPNGKFLLQSGPRPKCFVASSTGLAPFVEIINQIVQVDPKTPILVYFGVWNPNDDFAGQFLSGFANVKLITCCDECPPEKLDQNTVLGRVTQVIPEQLGKSITDYDFYICGNQFMVEAMEKILIDLDCSTIYMEKFSSSTK
jgi:ferredoxin-NADP reductase